MMTSTIRRSRGPAAGIPTANDHRHATGARVSAAPRANPGFLGKRRQGAICCLGGLVAILTAESGALADSYTNAGPRITPLQQSSTDLSASVALQLATTNGWSGPTTRMATSEGLVSGAAAQIQSLQGQSSGAAAAIPSSAHLLNVDLAADPSYKTGPAAVGHQPTDFWNCYWNPGVSDPTTVPGLLWSDQQPSGIDMTVINAPGGWGAGVSDPMFDGFLYPWDQQELEVQFNNLPPGLYDLFLYGHGPADADGCVFQVSSGSTFLGRRGTSIWSSTWRTADWQEGLQYVRYRQVPVGTGDLLSIVVEPDVNGYAVFNGLQVVASSLLSEPPVALHRLLNVNFAGSTPKAGPAAFGQSPADNWNWYLL